MAWNKHEEADKATAHLKDALANFIDQEMRVAFAQGCERGAFESRIEDRPERDKVTKLLELVRAVPCGHCRTSKVGANPRTCGMCAAVTAFGT